MSITRKFDKYYIRDQDRGEWEPRLRDAGNNLRAARRLAKQLCEEGYHNRAIVTVLHHTATEHREVARYHNEDGRAVERNPILTD